MITRAGLDGVHRLLLTQETAISTLPNLVYDLVMHDKVRVSRTADAEGHVTVYCSQDLKAEKAVSLLSEDFNRAKRIAETIIIPLFPSEPKEDILARIAVMVKAAFSDRPAF